MKPSADQPAGGAPWWGAPARCIRARPRPSSSAARAVGATSVTRDSTMRSRSTSTTSGTRRATRGAQPGQSGGLDREEPRRRAGPGLGERRRHDRGTVLSSSTRATSSSSPRQARSTCSSTVGEVARRRRSTGRPRRASGGASGSNDRSSRTLPRSASSRAAARSERRWPRSRATTRSRSANQSAAKARARCADPSYPPPRSTVHGPRIGTVTEVPGTSARRVDLDRARQSGVLDQAPQHDLGDRGPADVAGADEADPVDRSGRCG